MLPTRNLARLEVHPDVFLRLLSAHSDEISENSKSVHCGVNHDNGCISIIFEDEKLGNPTEFGDKRRVALVPLFVSELIKESEHAQT